MTSTSTDRQPLVKAFAIALVIGAVVGAFYVGFVVIPKKAGSGAVEVATEAVNSGYEFAKRVGTDLSRAISFTPRVTHAGTVVLKQEAGISQYALVSRDFTHEFSWESKWMGSTKTVRMRGSFIAKAGYDLTQPFSIDISGDGKSISATVPMAEVLSLELKQSTMLEDNGWWNRLSVEDRNIVMQSFLKDARAAIEKSDIAAKADAEFMQQLRNCANHASAGPIAISRLTPKG